MLLEKTNELGKIRISNNIFAEIILDSFALNIGKVWPATKKGKQIGKEDKSNTYDFGSTIEASEEYGELCLKFYIIIKFGVSIKDLTNKIFDYVFARIKEAYGKEPGKVIIVISGIKSKKIAAREIEVTRKNEFRR